MNDSLSLLEAEFRDAARRFPLYRGEITIRFGIGPRIPRYSVRRKGAKYFCGSSDGHDEVELTTDSQIQQCLLEEQAFWEFRDLSIKLASILSPHVQFKEGEQGATADGQVLLWALGNEFPPERDAIVPLTNAFICVAQSIASFQLAEGNEQQHNEGEAIARVLEIADPSAARIIAIADDKTLSADERMHAIAAIDERYYLKQSPQWATLLQCSAPNIRVTVFWKVTRLNWLAKQSE